MAELSAYLRALQRHWALLVLIPATLLLSVGIVGWILGAADLQRWAWSAAGLIGAGASLVAVVRGVLRRQAGVDVLALLAITGALWVGEYLAAALIAVMIGTGALLDQWAQSAAERELAALVARTPRRAFLVSPAGVQEVDVSDLVEGDLIEVPSGTIVPVDGRLQSSATFDESALTGESDLVQRPAGDVIRSGVVNAGDSVQMVATATAARSTYADIVRLVEQAHASSAPYVRLADRLSWWFIPASLAVAGMAWALSGDPGRAVAVLVVATPCPLLLAVPVAIISGVSKAAARGVVVKGGQVLEQLAHGQVLLFDKTGTLTVGQPRLVDLRTAPGVDPATVIAAAASVEQLSPHAYATAIVRAARETGVELATPVGVREAHGCGVSAHVAGVAVTVGQPTWVSAGNIPGWVDQVTEECALEGWASVAVAFDDVTVGVFLLADPMRPDAPRMLRTLRSCGVDRMVLVTGDRADLAESIGRLAGVDEVRAQQTPTDKVDAVNEERHFGRVIMVGDGINDAPALATADVGVALAGRGSSAASEAAGVVLTVDRIDRLADAIAVARRAHRIARQSAVVGMGLSIAAMVAAALGFLPAAGGALLQEAIDVVAIANALRVRLGRSREGVNLDAHIDEVLREIRRDHEATRSISARIRATADELVAIAAQPELPSDPLHPVRRLLPSLHDTLLAHEHLEEEQLLPTLRPVFGGIDPLASLSRTHAEIEHHVRTLDRVVELHPPATPVQTVSAATRVDTADNNNDVQVQRHPTTEPQRNTGGEPTAENMQFSAAMRSAVNQSIRTLYVLYGIVQLHNAQEDEEVFSLLERADPD